MAVPELRWAGEPGVKILLLGKNGQVGWELQRSLAPLGEVVALDRHSRDWCGDLENLDGLADTVRGLAPRVIVNAAAYTAVDRAEQEESLALRLNAQAPAVLAREAKALGAWLIHYSTDYVFDGQGVAPWREEALPAPLNTYGASKLAGDQAIQESGAAHLIFRASWVYGARGDNFITTMLRLARERERLTVIDDQVGAPTGAELLADVTAQALAQALVRPELAGLYHLAAAGETSWYGYARRIMDWARAWGEPLAVREVLPIPTSAYPLPARRPANSRLGTEKLRRSFGLTLPPWEVGVERALREMLGH